MDNNKNYNGYSKQLETLLQRKIDYQQFNPLVDWLYLKLIETLGQFEHSNKMRYESYKIVLEEWRSFSEKNDQLKNTSFGYPVNLVKRSFLVDFFRIMESFDVLQNNCGDIHDIPCESLNSKSIEWDIVRLIAENLGFPKQPNLAEITQKPELYSDGFWGYVTSGGSESNSWGIREGFYKYPKGTLYFCESAHYSIAKAAENFNYQVIPQISPCNDAIDVNALLDSVKNTWEAFYSPAIIVLTFGTTKYGAIDDIASIKKELMKQSIPHYLHVDAALYGGIPQNQERAPQIALYNKWKYDSICVSLHKYIGYPVVKSVVISAKKPEGKYIDYICQQDNTVAGSRDIPAFSLRQQVIEMLYDSDPKEYIQNIDFFIEMLHKSKIRFQQWSDSVAVGNVFVFTVDNHRAEYSAICERWELGEFVDKAHVPHIHVVIFPYHATDKIIELVKDLSKIVCL